ncbi:DUF3285 domain-containing protein [Arthrospira platensis]|jgi:hypothetical protein|uniref:DUF3285 domain-containing protein n=1 Tax=Limnospira platensis NIES-46 TaxID=1236695 RepID=A0A5M3TCP9_LIMPL|nr:DUF3285 domain-containing protein [Arthrospira platensis]AMW28067.1 hypothetical protein AP285_08845 [Arthrospira platensis YZ]MBD2668759.1 DUF3285 domain-containing protein [Arthrospira platensis FACHB-439]MBD2710124.1 DUF3285 domain-containing protein [Arthrospira platensis FACHB-835]MDF2210238.1 DUF3285 domain-containing protein [Arthrospira platensis NCB002]MDT9184560.1 DUF3285 domain-containing protein [Limnospira sp. PMC 289.06]QQW30866.1 DUF3285 domain-containing protein [Arthrospir
MTNQTTTNETTNPETPVSATEPQPSYVKLAMRNMVRKGSKSLFHFFLTTMGLIGLLVGLAYLTR